MSDFLREMAEASLLRARASRQSAAITALRDRVGAARAPLPLDVSETGFGVIAEAKLASPSEGSLAEGGTERVVELARTYERHGADAVSVLTEESRFAGSLDHLEAVAASVEIPVMRKDFLVEPVQIEEARAAGASGVLLIARLLPEDLLMEMTDLVLEYGMFALIEVFDRSDLETAAHVFDREVLVGVNCRDLSTLEVDQHRFHTLAPHLPRDLPAVAESGIEDGEDAASVASLGYRLALVGTALVRHGDPGSALSEMIDAGRSALTGVGR